MTEIQGSPEPLTLNAKLCVSMHIKKEKNLGKAYITSMRFDTGKKKNYFFDMKNFLSMEW